MKIGGTDSSSVQFSLVDQGEQFLSQHDGSLRKEGEVSQHIAPVSNRTQSQLVLSDTRVAFCLADVSGKGMSAALITANLQATLRAFGLDEPSPARLCHRLNQALCASATGRFVTLVYGILDRNKMTLTYELAGHNPPLLLRGPDVIELTGSGPSSGCFQQPPSQTRLSPSKLAISSCSQLTA